MRLQRSCNPSIQLGFVLASVLALMASCASDATSGSDAGRDGGKLDAPADTAVVGDTADSSLDRAGSSLDQSFAPDWSTDVADGGSGNLDTVAQPDLQRPNDGPFPDFLRAEMPSGVCPVDPPKVGDSCTLDPNLGCGYRPICDTGTPVNLYCNCGNGQWACDEGGFCQP